MKPVPVKQKDAIIKRLVIEPALCDKGFFLRERALFDALYKIVPDLGFWTNRSLKSVNSLRAFLTYDLGYIKLEHKKYSIVIPPNHAKFELSSKYGDDKVFAPKIKTIKQFLS